MLCPYCSQPVREQAKFCNNCGKSLPAGGAPVATTQPAFASQPGNIPPPPEIAPPASMPSMPTSDKAVPTGPLNRSAAPTNGAMQVSPGLVSPSEPASPAESQPTAEPDSSTLAAAPLDMQEDMAADLAISPGDEELAEPGEFAPSEQAPSAEVNPPAPFNAYPTLEAPEMIVQEAIYSADEEAPTVQVPRPARNEAAVTPELLASLGAQTPLAPGMILEDRYLVEEVLETSQEENLYRVSDQRGYLHCWACNSDYPDNPTGERFCSNCGADMLGRDYRLRERSAPHEEGVGQAASTAPSGAASLAAGEADLAAAEAGPPGVNGAHPDDSATTALPATESGLSIENEELDWPTQPTTTIASFIVGPRHYRVEAIEMEDPIFPLGVTLVAGARSDVGMTRRGNPNEDSILVLNFSRIHESISQPFGLFIVADGLGGHDDGQTASRRAIGEIASYLTREVLVPALRSGQFASGDVLGANLKAAIEAANLALVGSNEQTGSDMGSTVTGAMIVGDTAYVINVGDSRTYLYDGISLQPISIDHSLVMQLVAGGLIERDDIYTHPQRNQILRSLGDRRDVQVDLFTQKLRPNHQLVICCDGLWEMVRDPQIEQILHESSDPQMAADRLMQAANDNGGEDNISVIVVQARE